MRIVIRIICAVILLMQVGCIKDDRSDCFDDRIRFYLNHHLNAEDGLIPLNRGEIYVFDQDNIYAGYLSVTNGVYSKMEKNHVAELTEGLILGRYKAVSRAYLTENPEQETKPYTTSPIELVMGQTKLEQIVVKSTIDLDGDITTTVPMANSFAASTNFESIKGNTDVRLEYWQVNKNIDLNVVFNHSDGSLCAFAKGTKAFINCSDKEVTLDGRAIAEQERFDYIPYERTILEGGAGELFRFRKMTLDKTNTTPIIKVVDEQGRILYEKSLFTLLEGTNYPTQESLDKTDSYNVKIVVSCVGGHDTNVTINIWVNGWKYVSIIEDL